MSSTWRRARTLSFRDWRTLAEAAATLVWAHAAVRLRSPGRVLAQSKARRASEAKRRRVSFSAGHVKTTPGVVSRTAWLVGVAGRRLVRVPCLARSIALARVLGRRGVACDIRIGVRTNDGQLEAHAWVEHNGQPLNEDESALRTYAPFTEPLGSLPAARLMFR